jgi:hypothetical protein
MRKRRLKKNLKYGSNALSRSCDLFVSTFLNIL